MGQVDTAMATSGPSYDNNEWDYGGIKVTKLLSKKAGFELRHIWLQGLHSCLLHHRGLFRVHLLQCRWLMSTSNHYLRSEKHQPGTWSQPMHTGAPCKVQGSALAEIYDLCLHFVISFLHISCPFCPSSSPLLPSFALSVFFLVYYFNSFVDF